MWDIADTLIAIDTAFRGTGDILLLVVGTVVTALVALVGLGYAVSKVREDVYNSGSVGSGFFAGHEIDKSKVNWEELDIRMRRGMGSRDL